jgi:hypothetical protein
LRQDFVLCGVQIDVCAGKLRLCSFHVFPIQLKHTPNIHTLSRPIFRANF